MNVPDADVPRAQPKRGLPRVAVVGAGISGLVCARTLGNYGCHVTVFEKSRGVGGRMATRRTSEGLSFDHGAQYFTVREERFHAFVEDCQRAGAVMPWGGRICVLNHGKKEPSCCTMPRLVGVPGMNGLCRHLATDLDVRLETHVVPPHRANAAWTIRDRCDRDLGQFDWLVVSTPAPQAVELMAEAPELAADASSVLVEGCWAAMLSFDNSLELDFDGAFVHDSLLSWIARDNSKPGRNKRASTWVLHASPEWSRENMQRSVAFVLAAMLEALWQATGVEPRIPTVAVAHRWRYAVPLQTLDEVFLLDAIMQVGACGDWCSGSRVEAAFLSGLTLAEQIIATVKTSGR